jgi:hypothetical protein
MAGPVANQATQPASVPAPTGQVTVIAYGWGQGKSEVRVEWPSDVQRGDAVAQGRFIRQAITELTGILSSLPA